MARWSRRDRRFIDRFERNRERIAFTYKTIAEGVRAGEPVASDAEWLIDNYYVVEEQLREIREDLPRQFYLELPKLASGVWVGFPRVYELAHELVTHTDSNLDDELIARFVTAFQRAVQLTSGEIWAVPIMLRLVLVENLRRLCEQMLATREYRSEAQQLIERWQGNGEATEAVVALVNCPPLVHQFIECLRDDDSAEPSACLRELETCLERDGRKLDDLIRTEHHRLAANQVSIGNLITSMRLISALDWSLFFERVSPVEQLLRNDPVRIYPAMDFATRDRYRHVIERIAKRLGVPEVDVAGSALALADRERNPDATDIRTSHVGYYLVDDGRRELECYLDYKPTWGEWIRRFFDLRMVGVYIFCIGLLTVLGAWLGAAIVGNTAGAGFASIAALLLLLPISDLVIGMLNLLVTKLVDPQPLPKLEFKDAIPPVYRTIVAVPSMLTSGDGVRRLLERIEVHYLMNPEAGLQFVLLTDFADASEQTMPHDAALLEQAIKGIRELNERHGEGTDRFCLLHRERRFNSRQNCWMGWERKRGKLVEFNRLLRGAGDTSFTTQVGDWKSGPPVQFVITLDADSRLPHSSARRLIATLAHPLNRFSGANSPVRKGYGILQPRVSLSLESATRSAYARISSNSPGLDPYCTTVSDVYQDLFHEGSYTGKGIYDVDVFRRAIDDAFPENQILSHDLIEGCHTRVGLVSDIELFDDFPMRYDADARRQHRWVRGDWQLLPWLNARVPTAMGRRTNPLSLLSRWKIADNLRRSLVAPVLFLMLVFGWLVAPQFAAEASIVAALVLAWPLFSSVLLLLASPPVGVEWNQRARDGMSDLGRTLAQSTLAITFLAYKAHLMVDAVTRTLWRMMVSKRCLLEWETADATERRLSQSEWTTAREMWFGPFASIVLSFFVPASSRLAAAPFFAAWLVSPLVAYLISRPIRSFEADLNISDREFLRKTARKTWSFFERFVTEEDSFLPPDNYQEYPKGKIAHRVSPTNAGLYIASVLAARDFHHIGLSDLTYALERNLRSLERLERFCGHYYNWYDTRTLIPLRPCYVSTADSGNLACCLIVAAEGLTDVVNSAVVDRESFEGLRDSIEILVDAVSRLPGRKSGVAALSADSIQASVADLQRHIRKEPVDVHSWRKFCDRARRLIAELSEKCTHGKGTDTALAPEITARLQGALFHVQGIQRDLDLFAGWTIVCASGCRGEPSTSASTNVPALRWLETNTRVEQAWHDLWRVLHAATSLQQIARLDADIEPLGVTLRSALAESNAPADALRWLELLQSAVEESARSASEYQTRLGRLRIRYDELAHGMDFRLLYNPQRRLFAVGYNHDDGKLDRAHYDLLASEARLASLFAIAKGDVEHRHWFQLGRSLTETEGHLALLSWGGTMFEYLMPTLFTHDVEGSLIHRSCRAAVARQIAYGRQRGVPWGISESAFSALAVNSDYHYQSFGVPGLGLKRGLAKDLVVSPYSTALALAFNAPDAAANLRALSEEGADGPWGFYDAVDYTPERVTQGSGRNIVACYMAHHHGMTMVALVNCLLENRMRCRFGRHPLARATELLLQERVPHAVLRYQPGGDEIPAVPFVPEVAGPVSRKLYTAATQAPRTHLLSNGHYSVMVTNAGGGYSKCGDVAVTRWRPDCTCDNWGQFLYLRDLSSGNVWSAAHQPMGAVSDLYEVTYFLDKAEFRRRDGKFETVYEIAVSPENNAEVRQVSIANHGSRPATIEITSYAEIVLSQMRADLAHPAFNKLFVETEYVPEHRALLARRRPRDANQSPIWAIHVLASPQSSAVEYETDRAQFLGRGCTPRSPAAMEPGTRLTGSAGSVLDPIFSLRSTLRIDPESSASLAFVTAYASTRDEALALADQYHDLRGVQRTFELAWAHSQIELRHMHVTPATAQLYQRVASAVLFPESSQRAPSAMLASNRQGQPSLWRHGISGDDPIVMLRLDQPDQRAVVRELLLAHEFWHRLGLKVDIVILNDNAAGYFDGVHEQLLELVQSSARVPLNKPGGVYLIRSAHLSAQDHALFEAVAAVSLQGDRGSLERQFTSSLSSIAALDESALAAQQPAAVQRCETSHPIEVPPLEFSNHLGGFTAGGREYAIHLRPGQSTPAPWSNVIANPEFGCVVTETGGGFTWAINSRENKLTSWCNDPVSDAPSEVLYLRDDETGAIWSPAPTLKRDREAMEYLACHGHGYSRFVHESHGLHSEMTVTIAPADRVKIVALRLRNTTNRRLSLSAAYYVELVLGVNREQSQLHIVTSIDNPSGALLARNHYHFDLPDQVVFVHVPGRSCSVTGDRTEFLGRNGTIEEPAALWHRRLSGVTGAGLDPCAALQWGIDLEPGAVTEQYVLVGQCDDMDALNPLLSKYDSPAKIRDAMQCTREFWERTLSAVQIETPNRAFDIMLNRWLPYQTLSCRIWGRSAFYQAGGAFGFRDQLQDVMAVVYALPGVAREHLLRAAARQFEEGDVQHWWHSPTGRGVRTRFSDDLLWLPLATCHYVRVTGDVSVLDEKTNYLHSAPLEPHEDERYEQPQVSEITETLFEHCFRAIERAQRFGEHHLPLMGSGDWNDGMNKVGAGGKGESVWMGWFLSFVLREFADLIANLGQEGRAAYLREMSAMLIQAVENSSWDGAWYRRAFFDDGTPLGSSENDECRIDSLAQTWAVKAGANRQRAEQAMKSVDEILVREQDRLILLFDPPFDQTPLDPGYIKGYLPGIRENGGQYTHAALWVVEAHALLGHGTRAHQLWDLLNPARHAEGDGCTTYVVEPYVVAADVYGRSPHVGRGGWTWYTGSASWMYRVALERLLGVHLLNNRLRIVPCIPGDWLEYRVLLQRGRTSWTIVVTNPNRLEQGSVAISVDKVPLSGDEIELIDDGNPHIVQAVII